MKKTWADLEEAYFRGELYDCSKSELQDYLIAASSPPQNENPTFRTRAENIGSTVRVLLQVRENNDQQRANRRWTQVAAVAAAIGTAFLLSDHIPHATTIAPRSVEPSNTTDSLTTENVAYTASSIRGGLAQITIRNNNTYPVRNVQMRIRFSPVKSDQKIGRTLEWSVPDLIMPGTEFQFHAFDVADTSWLSHHNTGSPDEWIAYPEIVSAEQAK